MVFQLRLYELVYGDHKMLTFNITGKTTYKPSKPTLRISTPQFPAKSESENPNGELLQ